MILHFCSRDEWARAQATGAHTADSLASEGFIHCSTLETVLLPVNAIARGRTDLVLLEVDESRLAEPPRYEPSAEGIKFPHVYGPIPVTAVTRIHDFPCQSDGTFTLPATIARP